MNPSKPKHHRIRIEIDGRILLDATAEYLAHAKSFSNLPNETRIKLRTKKHECGNVELIIE